MRRTPGASASPAALAAWRIARSAIGTLLATPGAGSRAAGQVPTASPRSSPRVANANQQLQDLGAEIQAQQESVNKAIVDVQTARDMPPPAQQEVDASQARAQGGQRRHRGRAAAVRHLRRVDICERAVRVLPDRRRDPADVISTAAAGQTLSVSSRAGHDRSAAGSHRAGQQGIGRAAGQAECRQRPSSTPKPASRARSSALTDARSRRSRPSRPSWTSSPSNARPHRPSSSQARQLVGSGRRPTCRRRRPPPRPPADPSANWDRAPPPAAGGRNWDGAMGSHAARGPQRVRRW